MTQTSSEFVDHVMDLLRPLGKVSRGRFFGGHEIRIGTVQIGMVMGGRFCSRVSKKLRRELEAAGGTSFSYVTRKGQVTVPRYVSAPGEWLENPDILIDFARRNLAKL
jgi:DNA transformation protein